MEMDCGCSAAPIAAGCGCNGGYAPAAAPAPAPAAAPVEIQQPVEAAPAVVPPANASGNRIKTPVVDPNSFIIRNTGYRN
jgi:hypothetical protein